MSQPVRITAVIGTYRKGGMIDSVVDVMLSAAREKGAETTKIYLIDKHIEFCTNCRSCMQEADVDYGKCPIEDDMEEILQTILASDGLILASPMNFGTVTAVTKRFIERLAGFGYWPWGRPAPKLRLANKKTRRSVIVASSAAPAFMARLSTSMVRLMKNAMNILGARNLGVLFVGLAGSSPHPTPSAAVQKKARQLGEGLVG